MNSDLNTASAPKERRLSLLLLIAGGVLINVDGGINHERACRCKELGVDIIVGTIHNIFRQPDGIAEACRRFDREFA